VDIVTTRAAIIDSGRNCKLYTKRTLELSNTQFS